MNERDRVVRDRLRRLEGQVGGIVRMLEEGRPCEDVVTQLLAVRAAAEHAAVRLVRDHVDECMAELPPKRAREAVHEAVALLGRIG